MKYLDRLEEKLTELFAKFPSLPRSARTWLGANAWWIILVFAILDTFGVLGDIRNVSGIAVRNSTTDIYLSGGGSLFTVLAVISLIVGILVTVLYFMAVQPLKNGQRRGWALVYYALVTSFAFSIVSAVLSIVAYGNVFAGVGVVIGFVISFLIFMVWLYFLFQIRGEFGSRVANTREAKIVETVSPQKRTTKK